MTAAFSYTISRNGVAEFIGRKKLTTGTFASSGGATGGDINTGLSRVDHLSLMLTGAAAGTSAPSVNETMPAVTGVLTIVTDANAAGTWIAIGD